VVFLGVLMGEGGDFCLWVLGRVYFCGILVVSSWFFSQ
jgi:hypothetical protein